MTLSGIMVPVELVIPVVLGLVAALGWLARRYDKAIARSSGFRTDRRETAILLREALRERDPDLEPLSFDDESAVFDVEHSKDLAVVRGRSDRPTLSPRVERRLERFGRTGDPSTPPDPEEIQPRKKFPSRGGSE